MSAAGCQGVLTPAYVYGLLTMCQAPFQKQEIANAVRFSWSVERDSKPANTQIR